jgi:nuclear pore complex protein Nup205
MSGDSLIGSLYIAFINMLTGLSNGDESSQHCFVLLQNNSHFYESYTSKISWNHIFYAFEKYHDSFRIDQNQLLQLQQQQQQYGGSGFNPQPTRAQQFNSHKGITQQELQGLIAVIKLVNRIASNSEKARLALCEYQRGVIGATSSELSLFNNTLGGGIVSGPTSSESNSILAIMFGLIKCPISIQLKGEILNLLASFALSPQIAVNLWQLLEESQILPTIAHYQPQQYGKNDIKIDLEEVETRDETYPLLRGFLGLTKNLIKMTFIPENLGVGVRQKNAILGFQPYLQFLVNNVYLKVLYRAYKNPLEKWQITSEILEIFYHIIAKYELSTEDFQAGAAGGSDINQSIDFMQINQFKSPIANSSGYRLMYDLIHDGPIVRMLFVILNECLNHLIEFNLKNNSHIESSSLTCLKLVSLVLDKQKLFLEQMKLANLNTEMSGIEKLIITLNPSTNKCDYFMTILRFIQFNSSLLNHSYFSLNIVYTMSNYSLINTQLLNLFLKSCLSLNEQFELMHSFVEFLDYDENELNEASKDEILLNSLRNNVNILEDDSINGVNSNTSVVGGGSQQNVPCSNSSFTTGK